MSFVDAVGLGGVTKQDLLLKLAQRRTALVHSMYKRFEIVVRLVSGRVLAAQA